MKTIIVRTTLKNTTGEHCNILQMYDNSKAGNILNIVITMTALKVIVLLFSFVTLYLVL